MKFHCFKQAAFAASAAVILLAPARSQTVTGFSDLNYWSSGPNHSALIISWNDGKTNSTLAWGFSWSGTATVADLLISLAAADPRLFARIDSATGFGPGIFGLGYDTNGNGIFSVTGTLDINGNPTAPVFTAGISNLNTNSSTVQAPSSSENATPSEAADHYVEGWQDNGFWEFFVGGTSTSYPVSWTSSLTGASDTILVNNGWFAFSITGPTLDPDTFSYPSNPPGAAIAAVPEPSTLALLVLGGVAALAWYRKHRHAS